MGEIIGAGLSHHPGFMLTDELMMTQLPRLLKSPDLPERLKDPRNWPEPMQREYGENGDQVIASAKAHRAAVAEGFRQLRAAIDDFRPDFILIWGDDQYENFHEDIIPPFCIYLFPEIECRPMMMASRGVPRANYWGEPQDKAWTLHGHIDGGRYLARRLLEEEFDVAYAYKPNHFAELGHAFIRPYLYLDYDRKGGFDYPIVPFHINSYGSDLLTTQGGLAPPPEGELHPPAPTPRRAFELGRATARILKESPWRVVLVGSSSWSHGTLTRKHHRLYPDVEADQRRLEELRSNRFDQWANLTTAELEEAGQNELLNWVPLAGAMYELGYKAQVLAFSQTYIFNSSKCAVLFQP